MNCRHCHAPLRLSLVDLGSAPPSNAYLTTEKLKCAEKWFPLKVLTCESCWLVQTDDCVDADALFDAEYAYFSGFSKGWLAHSERYVSEMVGRFGLTADSHVVEVAANDGYLLQYVKARGIRCLGVEPTASTAAAAREKGIEIVQEFFGVSLGRKIAADKGGADLTAANNVLAHVPDINDFVSGFTALLNPHGVSTFEFPHLLKLIRDNEFDTIYHEHFSYLSLLAVKNVFETNGLRVFDVQELPTHGGSLRVFAQRADTGKYTVSPEVDRVLGLEKASGLDQAGTYASFQTKADRVKDDFVRFLLQAKAEGKTVAGYGAAAKGNTLLNYAGIRPDLMSFVVDLNPAKQNKFMPGSRIPIVAEARLREAKPDYIVILPWNIKAEVMTQLAYARDWGASAVTAVPGLVVAPF